MAGTVGRTIGEDLGMRRRRHFVGRHAEVDLFRAALEDDAFAVMHVSGPGGVGKTTLLGTYAEVARAEGATVLAIDGRDVAPTPAAFLDAVTGSFRVPPGDDAAITVPDAERPVILIDGYDELAVLDRWLREWFLPRLPVSAVTVLAGRSVVPPEWRADPAWSERLRVISLRNLGGGDAVAYLAGRGVPADLHAPVVALTFGHPLALSLTADALDRDPGLDLQRLPDDVVPDLLQRVVTGAPTATHRQALGVAAVARVVDEDLLRQVLDDTDVSGAAFAWLTGLSCFERRATGIAPHDLARDLLDADLRWREPDGYRTVFRAVQTQLLARVQVTTGREQQRAITDLKFCFRNLRSVLAPIAWSSWGDYYPDRARPADREQILDLVRSAEGEESAAIAAHWLDRQPDAFHVIRGSGAGLRGVIALLDLTAATAAEREADPGAAAVWRHVEHTAPAREDEVVTQCRFIVDAEAYQDPSPTLNAVPVLTLQSQLATPHLAWDFVTLAEPDLWTDFFQAADMARAEDADFTTADRIYGSFGHDFRRVPVETMTARWTERALADDALALPADTEPEFLVLAHADFAAAVRQGLRDLHRPDLLTRNPLLRTRLVAESGDAGDAAAVARLLRSAVDSLAEDPRDDRLFRAVKATYVRAGRTQEAAAAALNLPFSTYRRHLREGLDRVVAALWQQELRAPTAGEQE